MKTAAVSAPTSIWSRRPAIWIRLAYLAALNSLFSTVYRVIRSNYRLWRFSATHYGTRLEALAHLHAYLMCAWAKKRVPAYADFLAANHHTFRLLRLDSFPETSKETYVRLYGFAERCWDGRHPIAGTLVDESAGSSGTPYNWLRSGKELHDVHLDTANWVRWTFPTERLFALNAFSMGAWATGMNMGIALSKVCTGRWPTPTSTPSARTSGPRNVCSRWRRRSSSSSSSSPPATCTSHRRSSPSCSAGSGSANAIRTTRATV